MSLCESGPNIKSMGINKNLSVDFNELVSYSEVQLDVEGNS